MLLTYVNALKLNLISVFAVKLGVLLSIHVSIARDTRITFIVYLLFYPYFAAPYFTLIINFQLYSLYCSFNSI